MRGKDEVGRNKRRNKKGAGDKRGENEGMMPLRHALSAALLAVCGIASVASIFFAKPFNAQFFLGIIGALCLPAAFLLLFAFITSSSTSTSYPSISYYKWKPLRTLSIICLEFLILAYPIVASFAPHFHLDFNPIATVIVICAGIPAIYLSDIPIDLSQRATPQTTSASKERMTERLPLTERLAERLTSERLTVFNILWAIFGIALFLRAFLPYHGVFRNPVRYGADDPVFHMRLVENALFGDHFPFRIFYDAYTHFPFGDDLHFAPLYDQIIIFASWIIGLGHPTHEIMDAVGAYYPAILGACVVFPVYFIGKTLHNEVTGLIAAALVATVPGQFFNRSLLGYADHHVAEVLFSTIAFLFLILALKHARDAQDMMEEVRGGDGGGVARFSVLFADFDFRKDWAVVVFAAGVILPIIVLPWAWGLLVSFIFFCLLPVFAIFVRDEAKPLFFALAAGISLGVYLLMWVAGLLFVLLIFVYGLVQYVIDVLRGKDITYLCEVLALEFIIPLIMLSPFFNLSNFYDIRHIAAFSLGSVVFASPLMFKIAREKAVVGKVLEEGGGKRGVRRAGARGARGVDILMLFFPFLTLFVIAIVGFAAMPSAVSAVLGAFRALTPSGGALTVAEVSPLFTRNWAWWTLEPVTLYISYPALILLAWVVFRHRRPEHLLILMWCVYALAIIGGLIPNMGQNRFAYYFAVNASLLTAFFATITYKMIETEFETESVSEEALTTPLTSLTPLQKPATTSAKQRLRQRELEKLRAERAKSTAGARRKKGGGRRKEQVSSISFDALPIVLGIWMLALLIAGVVHVGISSLLPWLLIFLIPFAFWMHVRGRSGSERSEREEQVKSHEKNLRRALTAMLLVGIILFPFPLNVLATQTNSPSMPPNGMPAFLQYSLISAGGARGASDDWYDALLWMRNNTPDPGVDYYTTYKQHINSTTGRYEYPESAYGVMSWWDYGHIITFIGHRIPNANPFQAGIGGPPVLRYYDANGDGNYTKGEPVIADNDKNGKFSAEDDVMFGEKPRIDAKLRRFSIDEMYYDANDNYKYDKDESIVRDNDGDGRFTDGDDVLMGEKPPENAKLKILAFIPGAATFLLAQDEHTANKILDELGTRYVITEHRMIGFTCWVYPVWTGESVFDYCFGIVQDKITLGMPKFWRSMEIKLHVFDGCGGVVPYSTYLNEILRGLNAIRTELSYPELSYSEFIKFLEQSGILKILRKQGIDLEQREMLYIEPLKHYRLVHESPTTFQIRGFGFRVKSVKVFEYVKGARVTGTAPSGSVVEISTNVTTNRGRTFTYAQRMLSNGTFSFIVPYSTECPSPISVAEGGTNYDVCASPYKLRIGNLNVTSGNITWISEKEVHVSERDVLNGGTIEVA